MKVNRRLLYIHTTTIEDEGAVFCQIVAEADTFRNDSLKNLTDRIAPRVKNMPKDEVRRLIKMHLIST